MKHHRVERIAEVVREVAAETILFHVRDPRVKMVTVTRAEVAGDLQHAKVYVSIMGSEREAQLTMHGLEHAAGFIQKRLADRLTTRFVPTISFVLDKGVKNALEVARLLREARAETPGAFEEEAEGPAADEEE